MTLDEITEGMRKRVGAEAEIAQRLREPITGLLNRHERHRQRWTTGRHLLKHKQRVNRAFNETEIDRRRRRSTPQLDRGQRLRNTFNDRVRRESRRFRSQRLNRGACIRSTRFHQSR